jgi:hypothetical protein
MPTHEAAAPETRHVALCMPKHDKFGHVTRLVTRRASDGALLGTPPVQDRDGLPNLKTVGIV